MDEEQKWKEEVERAMAVIVKLGQALLDDNFEIVQCRDTSGYEFTGIEIDGRVLLMVIPDDIPQRPQTETLQ
jgi:hypothetical protein